MTNGSIGSNCNGNTKRCNPSKLWCFTLNNYTEKEYTDIIDFFGSKHLYYIGKEVGTQGTPHLQGFVKFQFKCRPLETKDERLSKRIHWEKCRGNEQQNIDYCSKEGNMVTNYPQPKPIRTLDPSKLYTWQREIEQIILQEPDDRTIYWYWEEIGNVGKTTFSKYLSVKHGAVPIEGKKNDILYCAAMFDAPIYIFDFERSMEDFISYGALEKVKNGYYMCSKYESKPIVRNSPHILCFANFEPDTTKLSADRWVIKQIGAQKDIIENMSHSGVEC